MFVLHNFCFYFFARADAPTVTTDNGLLYIGVRCFSPQFPGQISYTSSKYVNQLPVEVAGWIMREIPVQSMHSSVLVITADRNCLLGCGILTRGPRPGSNVTIGLSHLGQSAEDLSEMDAIIATSAIPMAKETDKLVPISWIHDRLFF